MKKIYDLFCVNKLFVVLLCILFLFSIKDINIDWLPRYPDPFGYLSNAAQFAGYDWSEISSQMTNYYGFGYGLFLAPLLLVADDFWILSKLIIITNALLHCGSFVLYFKLTKYIEPTLNIKTRYLISFTTACYSAYIYNINTILPEILAQFITVLIIYLFFLGSERKNAIYPYILLAVFLSFLPAVHGRGLGIWAIACAVILLMKFAKKINLGQFFWFYLIAIAGIILYKFTDQYVKDIVYSFTQLNNTVSDVTNTFLSSLSIKGLFYVLLTICSQMFYLCASTLSIYMLGLFFLLYNIIKTIKNRAYESFDQYFFAKMFILLSTIAIIGLSGFLFSIPTRIDQIFYGRHNEMFLGTILLYGMVYLYRFLEKLISGKIFLITLVFFIVFTIISFFQVECLMIEKVIPRSIIGINLFYKSLSQSNITILLAGLIIIVGGITLYFLFRSKNLGQKKNFLFIVSFIFIIYNFMKAYSATNMEKIENQKERSPYWDLCKYMEVNMDLSVVCLKNSNFDGSKTYLMQLLAYDQPVHYQDLDTVIKNMTNPQNNILLYTENKLILNDFIENCYLIEEFYEDGFYLWVSGEEYVNLLNEFGYKLIKIE